VHDETLVGGDVYDISDTAFGTRVMVADVQGKGLAAIGAAFAVVGAFREAAHREPTLAALAEALERAVDRQNQYAAEAGEQDRFVTALLLELGESGATEAVNCGHSLPYLLGPSGVRRPPLAEADLPLGLGALTADPRAVHRFTFAPEDTLLLFTDGVDESRDAAGHFFPLHERLEALRTAPPQRIASALRGPSTSSPAAGDTTTSPCSH
jgi:serine phosphatase RsbU (regulator of sigma subunit)